MKPQNKFTYLQQQIVNLILYNPEGLRKFLATVEDARTIKYVMGYISYLLPYRVGIEIDCAGIIKNDLRKKLRLDESGKLFAVELDTFGSSLEISGDGIPPLSVCNEVRASFKGFRQTRYFKTFLKILSSTPETLLPASNGGLHIHIDIGLSASNAHLRDYHIEGVKLLRQWYKYLRHTVFKRSVYTGDRDSRAGWGGSHTINMIRNHRTIEYRLGVPTFDYVKIMKWVMCCSAMTKAIRIKKPFNKQLTDAILAS